MAHHPVGGLLPTTQIGFPFDSVQQRLRRYLAVLVGQELRVHGTGADDRAGPGQHVVEIAPVGTTVGPEGRAVSGPPSTIAGQAARSADSGKPIGSDDRAQCS
ncbi:hypothetical protein ATO49_24325 [Mycolicibacterium fortuitum subsp. fortuitum DSM 46621 = ATCC 6841 = JCM 6387]|nr:hypothetical protein ATO49_24325 [Mycolicibacterium fortuitum subsp. fortuitum DSM 46621 = ATCC 6841 = JCM 6387]